MKQLIRQATARLVPILTVMLVTSACGHEDPPPNAADATPISIHAQLARVERVEEPTTIELLGAVEAEKTAAVSVRVMAMVTSVRVQAGDAVAKGQLLLEIDPQAAQGQLAQARGALAQARAALTLAERNFERFEALAATDAASELEFDMARMQHDQARGAVEQAEGAVAAASSVAADSRVVAPFAGRVARTMVDVGDLAAPGRPLLMLESEGDRRLALAVPESVMAQADLGIGSSLAVSLDARPDLGEIEATVVEMSPGADPATHSFEIKASLPIAGIPSGASGRGRLAIDRRTVVALPEAAVLRQGGLALVVVLDAEGRAGSRVVTLGEQLTEGRIEVLSGLSGGETVALGLNSVPPAGTRLKEHSS